MAEGVGSTDEPELRLLDHHSVRRGHKETKRPDTPLRELVCQETFVEPAESWSWNKEAAGGDILELGQMIEIRTLKVNSYNAQMPRRI